MNPNFFLFSLDICGFRYGVTISGIHGRGLNLILVELLLVTLDVIASAGLWKFEGDEPEHQAQQDDQHQGRAVEGTNEIFRFLFRVGNDTIKARQMNQKKRTEKCQKSVMYYLNGPVLQIQ